MKKPFWLPLSVLLKILAAATKLHRIPGIVIRKGLHGQENTVTEKANVLGSVAQLCHHRPREPEAEVSQVQALPGLQSEFKTNLSDSLNPHLKIQSKTKGLRIYFSRIREQRASIRSTSHPRTNDFSRRIYSWPNQTACSV